MIKMDKNMSLTNINKELERLNVEKDPEGLRSYFAGGMNTLCPFLPENVIAWISSSEKSLDKTFVHQRMILKVILKGRIISYVDAIPIQLQAGDAVLYFPHQLHYSKNIDEQNNHEFMAITFTGHECDYTPLLPLKNHVLKLNNQNEEGLCKIISAFQHLDETTPSQAICILQEFLVSQLQILQDLPEANIEMNDSDIFPAICNYIRKNFNLHISVKTIADEFHLTPHTIRRMFHKYYTDMTPGKLIRQLHIQYACELILRSSDTIANIAQQCGGFSDQFSFSRAFKKMTGYSPLAYRKYYRKTSSYTKLDSKSE
jgi:AraC-like DNA-binding protein